MEKIIFISGLLFYIFACLAILYIIQNSPFPY